MSRGKPSGPARRGQGRGGGQSKGGRGGQARRGGRGQRGTTPVRGDQRTDRPKGPGGDIVEGRHAVRELLLAGNRKTREVLFAADLDPAPILDEIVDLADEAHVEIREISRAKFEAQARTDAHRSRLMRCCTSVLENRLRESVKPTRG